MIKALTAVLICLVAASGMPLSVDAVRPVFMLGNLTYLGSGCPEEISISTSPDAQSVSVLFSKYFATTTSSVALDRKACSLMVNVDVLPGITIGIFKADYRGYAYVPSIPKAYTEFSASYFFAGTTGPTYKKRWGPDTDEDVFVSNNLTATAVAWSPCKTATTLRINTAIIASKPATSLENPRIDIDSADINVDRSFAFYLTYKTC